MLCTHYRDHRPGNLATHFLCLRLQFAMAQTIARLPQTQQEAQLLGELPQTLTSCVAAAPVVGN